METEPSVAEPIEVNISANVPPTLAKGQFILAPENARPGLIVMAHVVEQQDRSVEEGPIRSYVAPHDPDPLRLESTATMSSMTMS